MDFVGRTRELDALHAALEEVRRSGGGRLLSLRGRRQVGKSRLVEEFIGRAGAKAVYYVASQLTADDELDAFREAVAASPTVAARVAAAGPLGSWQAALALLAGEATAESPLVVVIDEFPYLAGSYPPIEGIVQTYWDRTLENKSPILLILIGSDLSTMESLSTYGRPLFGRAVELTLDPLSPAELGIMLDLDALRTLDAYLVLGGLPRLASLWHEGDTTFTFLRRQLSDPESPLIVLGERMLAAEFPADLNARAVLKAIGSGERTFTGILGRAHLSETTLSATLDTMETAKRLIERELPYSATPRPKLSRYTIVDPYVRFWLRFLEPAISTLERGRADVVLARIEAGWQPYRDRAIEPIVRRGIERLLPDPRFGDALFVGAYWNRKSTLEVDLVGCAGQHQSDSVDFVGSIKWRERGGFDRNDLAGLGASRDEVPGASSATRLVGVSRMGFETAELDVELGPDELLAAYGR